MFKFQKHTFLLAFIIFLFVSSKTAYGQQKAINGKVTDQNRTLLIGVTILESTGKDGASTY